MFLHYFSIAVVLGFFKFENFTYSTLRNNHEAFKIIEGYLPICLL